MTPIGLAETLLLSIMTGSVTRDWPINDYVPVIILQYSTNVGSDEF